MSMAPTTATAMHAVPVDKAGVGSAVLNSMRQVGGSLGIAVMGAIVASLRPPARSPTRARSASSSQGFQRALLVAAGIALRRGRRGGRDLRKPEHADEPASSFRAGRMSEPRVQRSRAPSERRTAVVETACRVFAKSSYRGSTTAQIARETGVTEPVLYRHFASKRELYLACLDAAWERLRLLWEKALAREEEPAMWVATLGQTYLQGRAADRIILIDLWIQALTEAADDLEIRRGLREQVREVHDFVADVIRRAQTGRRDRHRARRRRRGVDLHLAGPALDDRPPPERPRRRRLRPHHRSRRAWMTGKPASSRLGAGAWLRPPRPLSLRGLDFAGNAACLRKQKESPRLRLRGLHYFVPAFLRGRRPGGLGSAAQPQPPGCCRLSLARPLHP